MQNHSLTEGSVLKKLLLFALPILGANLLQALYGTVDLMIVGLFTEASEVSAVSTGSMTMQTITGIVIGLTMGCTVILDKAGVFRQYREYNENHQVIFEIGYHFENGISKAGESVLHVHEYSSPGVEHRGKARKITTDEISRYKKLFKGVKM